MTREYLIKTLLELVPDEYETKEDIIVLAKESESQIMQRIINAAEYYKNDML